MVAIRFARRDPVICAYDQEVDILTITLSDEAPDHGEQNENVIVHHGREGKPIEIEILDASTVILELLGPMLAGDQQPRADR